MNLPEKQGKVDIQLRTSEQAFNSICICCHALSVCRLSIRRPQKMRGARLEGT